MKAKNILIILLILILCAVGTYFLSNIRNQKGNDKPYVPVEPIVDIDKASDFDIKMISETHNRFRENYMISPLSIAYALTMLKEGASENTLKEIDDVLNNYELPNTFEIKNRVSIANLLFINEKYRNDINTNYINTLKTSYNSDILFDSFITPENINNWIKKKTFDMIPNAIDKLDQESTILGLANAIAIDVEWQNKFECNRTKQETFTKIDKTIMKTAMMHSKDDAEYIESKNAKGIIKDYAIYDKTTGKETYDENENTVALEYIAILPDTNIDDYMKIFDRNELNTLLNSKQKPSNKLEIKYSLPKYTYDFDYKLFETALKDLGINDAFDEDNAKFEKMLNDTSKLKPYVNKAIHKSHIELSESGTKASAVTVITLKNTSMLENEKKTINIQFDRPFVYIIKEKNTNNIWFFGTVYEPIKWEENPKCEVNYE